MLSVYGAIIVLASIIVRIMSMRLQENKMTWPEELKKCPKWMRITVNLLALYAGTIVVLQVFLFPAGNSLSDILEAFSAVPLSLNALSIGVIYSLQAT